MTKLIFLLLLALPPLGAIDSGLHRMCLSPHVDSPLETGEPSTRIHNDECVQKFPYHGTEEQHKTFCRSVLPYEYEVKQRDDTSVTCSWKINSTQCLRSKGMHVTQIYGKCYLFDAKSRKPCSQLILKLARPSSMEQIRWLSIYYRTSGQAFRVEESRALNVMRELRYDGGNVFKAKKDSYKKTAMLMTRLTPFEKFPGDMIPSDSPDLPELCMVEAMVTGIDASPSFSIPINRGNPVEERKKTGSGSKYTMFPLKDGPNLVGYAFVTRNDYLPKIGDDDLIDMKHFHEQCSKICTDCYAASYEVFDKYETEMPLGRFYVSAARRDFRTDEQCGAKFKMDNRKRFKVFSNPKNTHLKEYIPKGKHWWGGNTDLLKFPSVSCVDQSRTAVQIVNENRHLTYVDVPSFDRQPILCISGPSVTEPKSDGECYPNSHMSGGKCVCKDSTYTDALSHPEFKAQVEKLGFTKHGQICIKPQSCKEQKSVNMLFKGIVFLIDGSGSINYDYGWRTYEDKAVPFVQAFKDIFPKDIPIYFVQFSGWTKRRFLNKGWTTNNYINTMNDALLPYMRGSTETYSSMDIAMDAAQYEWGEGKKLLIVITDGDTSDYKPEIVEKRERYEYDTVFITIGNGIDESLRNREGKRDNVSYYSITNYSSLGKKLIEEITYSICDPWPEGHLLKAIYGEDWDKA